MRRGCSPSVFISRSASQVTMQPTPLSDAPVPTSHESKWQPTRTISFGPLAAGDLGERRWPTRRRARRAPPSAAGPARAGRDRSAAGCDWRPRRRSRPSGIFAGAVAVAHVAGVRRAQAHRARPRGRTTATAPCRAAARGAARAVLHRLAVAGVGHVEEHDLALAPRRPWRSRSWKLFTTSTSASMPVGGVATLPPRPSIAIGCSGGSTITALSCPRTQRGTITRSVRTLARPSAFSVVDRPLRWRD